MSKKNKPVDKKTTVGGQALIEGIMMKGVSVLTIAVRKKDGSIYTESRELPEKKWYNKAPFIRGCVNFVSQLKEGWECMNKSMEISGALEDDSEQTKFDKWLEKHFGEKGFAFLSGLLTFLMIAAMIGIFFFLPTFLFSLLEQAFGETDISIWKSVFEGVLKLFIFVGFMALTSLMKDMRTTYEYHGAEHKTIACYEAGKELTVENIKTMKRFHPRCGTSFIMITLFVSILVFSLVRLEPAVWLGIENKAIGALLRIAIKLPFLPVVVGISYELIRLAGRYTNILTKIISAPGLWMQRITTREPNDSQIEIAIEAVKPCLPKEGEDDNW